MSSDYIEPVITDPELLAHFPENELRFHNRLMYAGFGSPPITTQAQWEEQLALVRKAGEEIEKEKTAKIRKLEKDAALGIALAGTPYDDPARFVIRPKRITLCDTYVFASDEALMIYFARLAKKKSYGKSTNKEFWGSPRAEAWFRGLYVTEDDVDDALQTRVPAWQRKNIISPVNREISVRS